ncbi:superinfection immunity protein [Escherichia coli]|uniref:superinfection immunity protein n=1 Tax=Escherichia coli TaxID=562 RepID=UPI00197A8880|nr:superinfection immunity protein [Escherichia coli]EHX1544974.1 superinfection immunity protein [Escherichia coli]EIO6538170.1 superinfection immunity protein [Escherichia coli]EIO6556925.1 superinfection immunity protein [Escherichia coli]HCQ0095671.1 superinfection immunity protein [Escherichia coli]
MFVVRLIVLLFFVFYSYSMGQTPPDGLNAFGKVISYSFFIFAAALYALPAFEAWLRKHRNLSSIAAVNILLGWTFIGWAVAYVWSLIKKDDSKKVLISERPLSEGKRVRCPYCAEEVLAAAVKCKHCGSDISGAKK